MLVIGMLLLLFLLREPSWIGCWPGSVKTKKKLCCIGGLLEALCGKALLRCLVVQYLSEASVYGNIRSVQLRGRDGSQCLCMVADERSRAN